MEQKNIYNKTQLSPDSTFERHVFHRDQFAHYFRWTYVLKIAKIGMKILDLGCGSGNLAEVLYRNRYKAKQYFGIDVRPRIIDKANEKFKNVDWIDFKHDDLINPSCDYCVDYQKDWDLITCFEVLEHVGKQNVDRLLKTIKDNANENTIILLSSPNFNEKIGAASNHIVDGEISEWKHYELQKKLEENFVVEKKFGTFASQKDYKNIMNDWQEKMFENLSQYYDTNLLSNIMAPMFPVVSRNCLWVLKIKNGVYNGTNI